MKNVVILVPESSVLQSIADPQYCFEATNEFLLAAGKKPLFRVILAGKKRSVKLNEHRYTVHTDSLISEIKKADIIFIPALSGDLQKAISINKSLITWIKEQHTRGAEIASLCLGAFLLAETGLLNNGKCSTHWGFTHEFRSRFPEVELVDGGIITESNGIYSSGGANSYWNLLLHLVEKHTNREMSIMIAKYFAIDIDRDNQAAFSMFQGQKTHPDKEILKAQQMIEKSIHQRISVDEIASRLAIGRRSLERRFKSATGNSVLEYTQRVKMEAAKRSFETSMKTIQEVMYATGYSDLKAFRTIFRKITGLTPVAYRNKYQKTIG